MQLFSETLYGSHYLKRYQVIIFNVFCGFNNKDRTKHDCGKKTNRENKKTYGEILQNSTLMDDKFSFLSVLLHILKCFLEFMRRYSLI